VSKNGFPLEATLMGHPVNDVEMTQRTLQFFFLAFFEMMAEFFFSFYWLCTICLFDS
jgi:hypothetical protein